MTPEELDEARAKEAQRLWESGQEAGSSSWVVAARLAREGWTPPEPVDPDVLAFREWAAKDWVERYPAEVDDVQRGKRDGCNIAKAYLAGARWAREQESERFNHPVAFAVRVMAGAFKDLDSAKREAREALARIPGRA